MAEKRTRTRVEYRAQADIVIDGQKHSGLQTRDLSHRGVFLLGARQLPLGAQCAVTIHLFSQGQTPGPELSMQGTVVRSAQDGAAVEFNSMDADTYLHLRNLIILNAPDPDAVEEEFATVAFENPPE